MDDLIAPFVPGWAVLPQLERLDVGPADVGHGPDQRQVMVDEEPGEDPQVRLDSVDGAGTLTTR